MADGGERVTVKVVSRLADIPAAEWDACAGDDNPFLCHAFLEALEASGSATRDAGWQPQHLALEDEGGRLLGAVHAGDGASPAAASGGEPGRHRRLGCGDARTGAAAQGIVAPRHLPDARRMGAARRGRVPAARRPAIPLAE